MEAPARTGATAPVAEEQLAALREEIDAFGWHMPSAGFVAGCSMILCSLVGWSVADFLYVVSYMEVRELRPDPSLHLGSGVLAGFLVGLGLALLYRRYRTVRLDGLRDRLLALPAEERFSVLRPLLGVGGGSGRIANDLHRDLNLPTELTPSAATTSRGDEPTPAGEG